MFYNTRCDAGVSCNFNGTYSTGAIVSYQWDFGDGTKGSGPYVSHTYAPTVVPYPPWSVRMNVQLCVEDVVGRTNCLTAPVYVYGNY
jgi:hypothetical protein